VILESVGAPGTLIVICGLPYSGKTTLARRIEVERPALRLSPDEWIAGLLPPGWDRGELDRLRDPVEEIQWELARRVLQLGLDVVLEWGSWGRHERDAHRAGAREIGAGFELILLDVDIEVLVDRLRRRNHAFSITEEELRNWASAFERPTDAELRDVWKPGER
jgi:predicted kinase